MNIGLIGVGYWGKNYFRLLSQLSEVSKAYIYDEDKTKLASLSTSQHKICNSIMKYLTIRK